MHSHIFFEANFIEQKTRKKFGLVDYQFVLFHVNLMHNNELVLFIFHNVIKVKLSWKWETHSNKKSFSNKCSYVETFGDVGLKKHLKIYFRNKI